MKNSKTLSTFQPNDSRVLVFIHVILITSMNLSKQSRTYDGSMRYRRRSVFFFSSTSCHTWLSLTWVQHWLSLTWVQHLYSIEMCRSSLQRVVTPGYHLPEYNTCIVLRCVFLLFNELLCTFFNNLLQVVRVFLHHTHYVIHNVDPTRRIPIVYVPSSSIIVIQKTS